MFAFTADATGSNLPAIHAPWVLSGSGVAVIGLGASAPERVVAAVARDGFFVARSEALYQPP